MKRISSLLFSSGLIISAVVGTAHFFAPYLFAWYSYIPQAPRAIIVSIDYVNFFFSLLLTGLSIFLLTYKKKIFENNNELFALYIFFVLTWFLRVVITVILPWPTALQPWLVVGFSTEFLITLIPAIYLLKNGYKKRQLQV